MECVHCKNEIPDGSSYCPECGARQTMKRNQRIRKRVCPICGLVALPGDEYCEECGYVFGEDRNTILDDKEPTREESINLEEKDDATDVKNEIEAESEEFLVWNNLKPHRRILMIIAGAMVILLLLLFLIARSMMKSDKDPKPGNNGAIDVSYTDNGSNNNNKKPTATYAPGRSDNGNIVENPTADEISAADYDLGKSRKITMIGELATEDGAKVLKLYSPVSVYNGAGILVKSEDQVGFRYKNARITEAQLKELPEGEGIILQGNLSVIGNKLWMFPDEYKKADAATIEAAKNGKKPGAQNNGNSSSGSNSGNSNSGNNNSGNNSNGNNNNGDNNSGNGSSEGDNGSGNESGGGNTIFNSLFGTSGNGDGGSNNGSGNGNGSGQNSSSGNNNGGSSNGGNNNSNGNNGNSGSGSDYNDDAYWDSFDWSSFTGDSPLGTIFGNNNSGSNNGSSNAGGNSSSGNQSSGNNGDWYSSGSFTENVDNIANSYPLDEDELWGGPNNSSSGQNQNQGNVGSFSEWDNVDWGSVSGTSGLFSFVDDFTSNFLGGNSGGFGNSGSFGNNGNSGNNGNNSGSGSGSSGSGSGVSSSSGGYIIPNSDTKALSWSDLDGFSLKRVNYAKNEIYARHGRRFNSPELQRYFNSKSWYRGTIDADDFSDYFLTQVEKDNIDLLREKEFSLSPDGYILDQN